MASSTLFESLPPVPCCEYFRILSHGKCKSIFAVSQNSEKKLELFEYSVLTKKWNIIQQHNKLPQDFGTPNISAFDYKTKTVYLFNEKGSFAKLQIKNDTENKWEIINDLTKIKSITTGPQAIIINNECHIIGGWGNEGHLKYNNKTKQIELLHKSNDENIMVNQAQCHQLIRVKNKILMFGGFRDGSTDTDKICEYDILSNKWNLLNAKMPHPSSEFGIAPIIRDQYILLIGGTKDVWDSHDEIWIYSVRDQKFKNSSIKCPRISGFVAVTLNDTVKDEMAVYGFVRNIWKASDISDHLFPPHYLVKIICGYYLNEFVHLFDAKSDEHYEHWRINVFDIIS